MLINELIGADYRISSLNNVNVVVGRNGSGKSTMFRAIEVSHSGSGTSKISYVSPERSGTFYGEGHIISAMKSNPNWIAESRRVNQSQSFKNTSAVMLRDLELMYLRKLASIPEIRHDLSRSFENDCLRRVNDLLLNVRLVEAGAEFEFISHSGEKIQPDRLSSGESEAVSLAAEILFFFETLVPGIPNVILIDEPDVHLHPDLQARLGHFLLSFFEEKPEIREYAFVVVATHSTALTCSLATSKLTSIGTKPFGVNHVRLRQGSDQLRKLAPFFGHPLSLSLSDDAPVIVEGEDDERIWQQAARTSEGKLRLFPVIAETVSAQTDLEKFCANLISTIYDKPVAFSIRDGDGKPGKPLDHIEPLKRYRLECYAMENLLVTDECLEAMGSTWSSFVAASNEWLNHNTSHRDADLLRELINSQDRLRHKKIKDIRNLICGVLGEKKIWEIVVGQVIGGIAKVGIDETKMVVQFFGADALRALIERNE